MRPVIESWEDFEIIYLIAHTIVDIFGPFDVLTFRKCRYFLTMTTTPQPCTVAVPLKSGDKAAELCFGHIL